MFGLLCKEKEDQLREDLEGKAFNILVSFSGIREKIWFYNFILLIESQFLQVIIFVLFLILIFSLLE